MQKQATYLNYCRVVTRERNSKQVPVTPCRAEFEYKIFTTRSPNPHTDQVHQRPHIHMDSLNIFVKAYKPKLQSLDPITSDLVDTKFLEEIEVVLASGTQVFFGKSLRDLKCIIVEEESQRRHEISLRYEGTKKLSVLSMGLPCSNLQDMEFSSLEDILECVRCKINGLSMYFRELEQIDKCCTVMEPVHPTFKENYRRILLDDRTWLHVEVTPEGLATNIHLVGQSEHWQDLLQTGLLNWDHDKDIVDNIMDIFGLTEFPTAQNKKTAALYSTNPKHVENLTETVCSICLCSELPDCPGVPLPLCQNSVCGVYFHRNCLYQWLVACSGGRPPTLGVATGSCPSCLCSIACNDKDN